MDPPHIRFARCVVSLDNIVILLVGLANDYAVCMSYEMSCLLSVGLARLGRRARCCLKIQPRPAKSRRFPHTELSVVARQKNITSQLTTSHLNNNNNTQRYYKPEETEVTLPSFICSLTLYMYS